MSSDPPKGRRSSGAAQSAGLTARMATTVDATRRGISKAPRALKLLMALGFIHALAWAVAIAPLTGPDEDNHAAVVQHIAETGHGVQFSHRQRQLLDADGHPDHRRRPAADEQQPGARPTLEGWDASLMPRIRQRQRTQERQRAKPDRQQPAALLLRGGRRLQAQPRHLVARAAVPHPGCSPRCRCRCWCCWRG